MTATLMLSLTLLILTGCEEFLTDDNKAVFVCQYINHAWGYQNSGYLIDTEGNVRVYNLPEDWNYPDSEGYISAEQMEENMRQLGEVECIISGYDMTYFTNRLQAARQGKISEAEHRMCDAGGTSYGGFLFDPDNNRYKYVFIRLTGDFYKENLSRAADEIYEWMKDPCKGTLSVKF